MPVISRIGPGARSVGQLAKPQEIPQNVQAAGPNYSVRVRAAPMV
jgi:hypothetical protein